MPALTESVGRDTINWGAVVRRNWVVSNAVTIFVGSLTLLRDDSTTNRGSVQLYADEPGALFTGLAVGSPFSLSITNTIVGDTSLLPIPQVTTEAGPVIERNRVVTGASTQADVGRRVFASNDNDLSLTSSLAPSIGLIVGFESTTEFDVLYHGFLGSVLL